MKKTICLLYEPCFHTETIFQAQINCPSVSNILFQEIGESRISTLLNCKFYSVKSSTWKLKEKGVGCTLH